MMLVMPATLPSVSTYVGWSLLGSLLSPRKRPTVDNGGVQRKSSPLVRVSQNSPVSLELDSCKEAEGGVRTPDTSLEARLLI